MKYRRYEIEAMQAKGICKVQDIHDLMDDWLEMDAHNAQLRGAMVADNERLQAAAEKSLVTYSGCDTSDDMADEILYLRSKAIKIKSPEMYSALLRRVSNLMDAKPGSDDEHELEILAELIEKYEDEHYPIKVRE